MKKGVDETYLSKLSEGVSKRLESKGLQVNPAAVRALVSQEGLRKEVGYLHNHGMPDDILYSAVEHGIRDAQRTQRSPNTIRPEDVALSIYGELRASRKYGEMAQELVEKGIIDKKDARRFESKIERALKIKKKDAGRSVGLLEDMVKRAAIYIPFAISAAFLLAGVVKASVTGAIIGGGEVDFNVLFGIGFLLLGLAIHHFSVHN